jgi:Ribbon-helix-helix protein, copG family
VTEVLERPLVETGGPRKKRLSVDVSPEMKQVIDALAEQDHTTQTQIMRQAVALLKVIKDAEKKGQQPALIDEEGNVTVRLYGV